MRTSSFSSSTRRAPWTIVEANDKHYARVKTLRTLSELLASELGTIEELGGSGKKNKKKNKSSEKNSSKSSDKD